ncbi:hypothetical protein JOQ06_005996 [Pogonophryne albipinna]|uniref:Uncharacterized protein n=1 Tax=Pogonophryne albipinna TaxID=1090488 RepID=A0AAD6FQT1_9TELE|nr:hypothetical protein JOQ06_005996 [Pogonophryne albipinna]
MKVKILRHKKDEVELAGSKRNDDVVVRVVEEEVEDSEGHSSDEGNMSDVWNGEREESGNEEQEVQRQKEKDLLFEREMRGEKERKEKAATRARREELKGWKRISVDLGKETCFKTLKDFLKKLKTTVQPQHQFPGYDERLRNCWTVGPRRKLQRQNRAQTVPLRGRKSQSRPDCL